MFLLTTFFSCLILLNFTAMAQPGAVSAEDTHTLRVKKALPVSHKDIKKQPFEINHGGKNQGQSSSTAYAGERMTIIINVATSDEQNKVDGTSGAHSGEKSPGQPTYSTHDMASATPVSQETLNLAIALDALKKKLKKDNKKKKSLQDISPQKTQGTPNGDLISKLFSKTRQNK